MTVWVHGDRIYNFTTGGSVHIAAGRRSVTFPFHVGAPDATFTLDLSAQTLGHNLTKVAQVKVRALDPARQAVTAFRVNATEVVDGDAVDGTVELLRPAPPGGIAVALWPNSTYEYGALALDDLWVVVPAGRSQAKVRLRARAERPVLAQPSADLGTSRAFAGAVVAPDALSFNGSLPLGQTAPWLLGVGRAAHPAGAVVTLSSDMPGVSVPATVTVPADRATAWFPVAVAADIAPWTTVTVTASWNGTTVSTVFFTYPPA
ncbi:hypothetical protein AB0J72_49410 [Dactylosporangium sp. NPDC049742]|uniref:hypothetical protein n=1 Tax=Dactylosporangium sp. NPDC049742 TaxID=3154737 RepID=UPI0034377D32